MIGKRFHNSGNHNWWVFIAIAVGLFTSVADFGSLIVALPTISEYFRTDLPTTQWVLVGYSLAISALLLPMGRLADLVGRKSIYLLGCLIFVIGAVAGGFSPNVESLIFFKVIQGIGASMTQGVGMAIALSHFPMSAHGKVLGFQITTVGTGNILGPLVGGVIVGFLGWRWIFLCVALLGLLSMLVALVIIDEEPVISENRDRNSYDWLGAFLSACILLTFLLTMTSVARLGWSSPAVIIALSASLILIIVFVYREIKYSDPMIDLRHFKKSQFTLGVVTGFTSFVGNSSVRYLLPFFLQAILKFTPQTIGMIILPSAVTMILTGPLSGRLSDRFGYKPFTLLGLLLSAVGLLILSYLDEQSSLVLVIFGMVINMSGTGILYPPNNSSILSTVNEAQYGVMAGFVNLFRNVGNIMGVVLTTLIVTSVMDSMGVVPSLAAVSGNSDVGVGEAFVKGMQVAYKVLAGLIGAAILAFVLDWFSLKVKKTSGVDS